MRSLATAALAGALLLAAPAAALEPGLYRIETTDTLNGIAGTPQVITHCFGKGEVFDQHRAALARLAGCAIRRNEKGHIEAACDGTIVTTEQSDKGKSFTDVTRKVKKDPITGQTIEDVSRTVGTRQGDCH
ncbi:MAG TPA: hypothetical protein VKY65_07440 [Alphaproteobacteria bacterium]|nr:hypothetical protein [Alphaproteobacteria bacterium]